jgi:hypothetical protein
MDQRSILDHEFVIAAYTLVWVVQLGYVAFVVRKWLAEKRKARSNSADSR